MCVCVYWAREDAQAAFLLLWNKEGKKGEIVGGQKRGRGQLTIGEATLAAAFFSDRHVYV